MSGSISYDFFSLLWLVVITLIPIKLLIETVELPDHEV